MSDQTDAVPRVITDDAELIEDARRQLDFLEEGMHALADTPAAPSLLDEAYRAAHSLKAGFAEAEMPQAARIARLVQDCVQAVRAGRLRASADLGALFVSAARAARDVLDARVAGRMEPGSAAAAASALEHLLARPAASLTGAEERPHDPLKLSQVDARQLQAAKAASQTAASAAASFAKTCGDAGRLLASFREMARKQDQASRELLDALPKGLAEAANGVPPTAIAADLAERIAALGATVEDFEESMSRFTGTVRDAATTGARAAAASGVILSRMIFLSAW